MSHKLSNIIASTTFSLSWILIAVLIYLINDDTQALPGIFRPEYLIPVLLYSGLVISLCYGLYSLLKKALNSYISLAISLVLGIPIALYIVVSLGRLVL
jgi:hypothetical protein